ncbi:MAG: DUF445 family protein [Desulfobulbaceae bacterium]|nr:DUF445 family protein [Desulfobulbaceae bacterium]
MFPIDYSLLNTLAHPCIGAFIGYLTNKIAIRMLFRPLRPWYVFGLKVPMTPGVIPSKRHDLAVNIGEMVGRHLLTSKDIGSAISGEPFQEHLAVLVDRKVQEVLKRDLGPLPEIIPERFKAYFQIGVKTLKYQLGDGVNGYLASSGFEEKITVAILARLDDLADQDLNSLLAPENRKAIYLLLNEVVSDLLASDRTVAWLAEYLVDVLQRAAAQGRTVGDLLPEQLITLLQRVIRYQAAAILQAMGPRLSDPLLRKEFIRGMSGAIDHFLDSLGPVGAMARGFLEMDTFEQKVGEYLDGKEDDLSVWLQNPEVQTRMAAVLAEYMDVLLQKTLADVLTGLDADRLGVVSRAGAEQFLAVFRTEGARTGLSAMLHVGMEELLEGGQRRLGALAGQFFPGENGLEMRDAVIRECIALFRSNKTERLVNSMIHSMVDALLTRPVGRLYDLVPHGVRQGLTEFIILTANRMLLQEVPGVVESLNIKRVVTDKVDSLNLLQLERLLLSIMEEQFKYINLFGALLGFLLGLINLALVKLV